MHHCDLPGEASPRPYRKTVSYCASLPPQHAQHRRALGTPELRAGLRRKEGYLLSLPSIYEPVCAQSRALTGSTCWATIFRPCRGWFLASLNRIKDSLDLKLHQVLHFVHGNPVWEIRTVQMKTKPKFKSDAFEAIHSSASALAKMGAIDKTTMRSFDTSCLTVPAAIKPHQIKQLRERHHVSQPVFARYLNTSESTVEKWESGAKRPSGMALKLLAVVQKNGLKMLA